MNFLKKHPTTFDFIACLFVVLLSIPLILPYFHSGYFPTHDGEWAVVRLADMFRSLRDLQFPVRFSGALNFGYGYPLFNFAYPGPYYLGVLIYFLAGSFTTAIKIMFALSVPLSGVGMYLVSKRLWGGFFPGTVAAIVYMYLPYRMVDLYVRGSIGESLSFILFPIILYFGLRLIETRKVRDAVLLSISLSLLVITHNIMTVLFLPVLTSIIGSKILHLKGKHVVKYFGISILLALSLSAFFWVPAILEKGFIALSVIPIADRNLYFVTLEQLIIPSWGFGQPTQADGFTYQLGISQIVVILTSIGIILYGFYKKTKEDLFFPIILLTVWFVMLVLMFSPASFVWENVPLLSEINYPWTLLSMLGFVSSLIAGLVVVRGRWIWPVAAFVIVAAALPTFLYAKPSSYVERGDNFYLTNEATTTSSDELMPLWVKQKPQEHFNEKVITVKGQGKPSNIIYNSKKITFDYDSNVPSVVRIATIYYPGWSARSNLGEKAVFHDDENGLIELKLTREEHKVTLEFRETALRLMSNIISLTSVLLVVFLILKESMRKILK